MDAGTRPHGLADTSPPRKHSRPVLMFSIVLYGLMILAVAGVLGLMWVDMVTGNVGELLLAGR